MSEEKFLYYLGAGASAQVMPTVNPIYDEKGNCINIGMLQSLREMSKRLNSLPNYSSDEQQIFLYDIAKKLEDLANESSGFTTIDTYAKYLYLKHRNLFDDLKFALAAYFSIAQIWDNKLDRRYLGWLTSILTNLNFPENIKILTWNYDYQLQLAADRFRRETFKATHSGYSSISPLIGYWPSVGHLSQAKDNISLVHLNGLAGAYSDDRFNHNVFLQKDDMLPNGILLPLRKVKKAGSLSFAWETDNYQASSLELAQKIIADTSIIIVIGYSFPFFNRDIDKKVFETIKTCKKLKKIYFQDPVLDGSFLKAQFDLDDTIEIVHRKEVDSFYIPFEL
jgi:hypothetical protein